MSHSRVGKGFSESTLRNARKFYEVYSPSIQQTLFIELDNDVINEKQQTLISILDYDRLSHKNSSLSKFFKVSWSHYLILMRVKNDEERRFYELEAAKQQWTFRQLRRQYGSSLYERLALSRDKDEVMRLAKEGQQIEQPRDVLKNPFVLEFLNLEESTAYSETDLESAIISKLSKFLKINLR